MNALFVVVALGVVALIMWLAFRRQSVKKVSDAAVKARKDVVDNYVDPALDDIHEKGKELSDEVRSKIKS